MVEFQAQCRIINTKSLRPAFWIIIYNYRRLSEVTAVSTNEWLSPKLWMRRTAGLWLLSWKFSDNREEECKGQTEVHRYSEGLSKGTEGLSKGTESLSKGAEEIGQQSPPKPAKKMWCDRTKPFLWSFLLGAPKKSHHDISCQICDFNDRATLTMWHRSVQVYIWPQGILGCGTVFQ